MTRLGRAIRPAVCADSIRQAVGVPATFGMATELIRPGGTVANVGVHGTSAELKLQDLWIKDVAITTGLVSATTTPMLDAASWCHHLVPRGVGVRFSGRPQPTVPA
jgi:threonine dehydrogenase-like Zn-dependent dehydrogenase